MRERRTCQESRRKRNGKNKGQKEKRRAAAKQENSRNSIISKSQTFRNARACR
jgi:hypothetical protein